MKKEKKLLLLLGGVIVLFITVIILTQYYSNKLNEIENRHSEKFKIQFKGHIINSKKTQRLYMICVKLDYTNIDSFYSLDESLGLKIKNGTAVMTASSTLVEEDKVDYVEVNMNEDGKQKFYSNGKLIVTYDALFLGGGGLTEEDMNVCN
ncbi:hypothetical protein [Flavobacterium sp. MMS24-S5]|uniref:hypothetical protein n=1 Tax=Flavobacterium sp. MMS24-S5 TaxID=3416605 RepID=UPI003D03B841